MRVFFILFLIAWFPLHGVSLAWANAMDHGACGTQVSADATVSAHTCHDHDVASHAPAEADPTVGSSGTDSGAHCSACHLSFANYLASEIVVLSYDDDLDQFSSFASTIYSCYVSVPERIPVALA